MAALVPALASCAEEKTPLASSGSGASDSRCSIDRAELFDGGPGKDGIPALTNPPFVSPRDDNANYVLQSDRVIGLIVEGQALAVPHNIGWWHEIVNLDHQGRRLAITYCPLTGSALVFDRDPLNGAEFGVSGLLFRNNLVMYDRTAGESLWPQMLARAGCGPKDGTTLTTYPFAEMTWGGWLRLHPDTRVVSSDLRPERNYAVYPYGDYEIIDNPRTLFPARLDPRRPPKERVLGIPHPGGGIAFPFGELDELGAIGVVEHELGDKRVVVFWDSEKRAAVAHRPIAGGRELTFQVAASGLVDTETGSAWAVDGRAISGPLAGQRLEPVPEAFVAFWFAWAEFNRETDLWTHRS